jgi:hypothetical protein
MKKFMPGDECLLTSTGFKDSEPSQILDIEI